MPILFLLSLDVINDWRTHKPRLHNAHVNAKWLHLKIILFIYLFLISRHKTEEKRGRTMIFFFFLIIPIFIAEFRPVCGSNFIDGMVNFFCRWCVCVLPAVVCFVVLSYYLFFFFTSRRRPSLNASCKFITTHSRETHAKKKTRKKRGGGEQLLLCAVEINKKINSLIKKKCRLSYCPFSSAIWSAIASSTLQFLTFFFFEKFFGCLLKNCSYFYFRDENNFIFFRKVSPWFARKIWDDYED